VQALLQAISEITGGDHPNAKLWFVSTPPAPHPHPIAMQEDPPTLERFAVAAKTQNVEFAPLVFCSA